MTLLNIVYEDDSLLVVDKPAGLLMHPSWLDKRETDTLASRIKQYLSVSSDNVKVHTVHRLDRPTSGLVVISKDAIVARTLSEQFVSGDVKKTYWAICRGFAPEQGLIDYPLIEEHDKIADKFAASDKPAQEAQTQFHRLGIAELSLPVSRYNKMRLSWLECQPLTGRKHQIRRHLKHIRHPIIGDTRHGCRHHNKECAAELGITSLALRAVKLEFTHPVTDFPLKLEAPLDERWRAWFETLGWVREC